MILFTSKVNNTKILNSVSCTYIATLVCNCIRALFFGSRVLVPEVKQLKANFLGETDPTETSIPMNQNKAALQVVTVLADIGFFVV